MTLAEHEADSMTANCARRGQAGSGNPAMMRPGPAGWRDSAVATGLGAS